MIDIKTWMDRFVERLLETFPNRITFVGLQGSYGRGEATEHSDIDVVVILDTLTADDLRAYSVMLDGLPNRELVCGFVSGREELLRWEPSDLFQFVYDTTPVIGSLDMLLERMDDEAIERAIRIGACNLYHACVHNMVHEKSVELLRGFYKAAVFVIQALHFRRTGRYVKQKAILRTEAQAPERILLENELYLKGCETVSAVEFWSLSTTLFEWAQGVIDTGIVG